jgi:hypothetical protein
LALGAFLKLDQTVLFRNDFSDESGQRLTGTVYTNRTLTTAFDLTGYTLTLRFHKEWHSSDYLNKPCTINVAANGTFYRNITRDDLPTQNVYLAKLELTKTGSQISTLNRQEIIIKNGAIT